MTRRHALSVVGMALILFGVISIGTLIVIARNHGGFEGADAALTLFGLGFIAGGGYMVYTQRQGLEEENWLRENGDAYTAQVISIERTVKSPLTGSAYYTLTASVTGLATANRSDKAKPRRFVKNYGSVKPFLETGDYVTVYVDPTNHDRFYISEK